jgi:hypothetical protein
MADPRDIDDDVFRRVIVLEESADFSCPKSVGWRVNFSSDSQPMTISHLVLTAFRQAGVKDPVLLVRRHDIVLTTAERVAVERDRYHSQLTLSERLELFWKQTRGAVDDDPPILHTF